MPHTNVKTEWVGGNLIYKDQSGNVIDIKLGAVGAQHSALLTIRKRFTIAEVNAGATILPAVDGLRYRMVDAAVIAVGGAAAAHTSIDIIGTVSTARKLVAFLVAGTTRSTLLRAGAATNGVILADGASFTQNDLGAAITIGKTGSDVTTATDVDVIFSFAVEA